jgi:hypothetical protein
MIARAGLGATVRRAAAGALVASAAGVLVGAVAFTGRGVAAGAPSLALDATGPLFAATQLAPGSTTIRCVTLSWTQADTDTASLYFYASASGTLASYLTVTVETGSGGSSGSCAGFAGTLLYSGGLDQLAATHGDPTTAMALADSGAGNGSRTFRFTTTVLDDNAAQGATAGASFAWGAEPNNPSSGGSSSTPVTVPVTPTGSGTPTPSASASTPTPTEATPAGNGSGGGVGPTDSATPAVPSSSDAASPPTGGSPGPTPTGAPTEATASPGPTGSISASPTALPTPTDTPSAAPSPGSGGGRGQVGNDGGGFSGAAARAWHAVSRAAQVVVQAAPAAIRGGAFGLGSFPILLLFLLLQRHIDRRDPKLALAPSHADAYLDFDPPTEDGR